VNAGLVGGVLAVNAVYVAVGLCLLSFVLRGGGLAMLASYSGLALLFGAGACGVALSIAAVAGATVGLGAFWAAAAALALGGLAAGRRFPRRRETPAARSEPLWGDALAAAAAAALAALACFALVGGFRSSPWLDDVWGFWIPKGMVLGSHGLVTPLWTGSEGIQFSNPDYPLWWSIVTTTSLRFVGGVDLHAVNAQLAVLVLAFVAAVARLLWGHVRPWVLWTGLALLAAMPELFRQAQGGGADVPLALYLTLFCLTGVMWLLGAGPVALVSAALSAAAAFQIKSEGAPQLVVLALVLSLVALRSGWRRLGWLWGAVGAGAALAAPWFAWRSSHDVSGDFTLSRSFDASYLSSRTARIGPAADALRDALLTPRHWLVAVPLLVVLALVVAVRERDVLWLVVPLAVGIDFLFWIWVNWSDPLDLSYRLTNSAYRVIDAAALLSAAFAPLLAEQALSPARAGARRAPARAPAATAAP
jgi:hypothetical protein